MHPAATAASARHYHNQHQHQHRQSPPASATPTDIDAIYAAPPASNASSYASVSATSNPLDAYRAATADYPPHHQHLQSGAMAASPVDRKLASAAAAPSLCPESQAVLEIKNEFLSAVSYSAATYSSLPTTSSVATSVASNGAPTVHQQQPQHLQLQDCYSFGAGRRNQQALSFQPQPQLHAHAHHHHHHNLQQQQQQQHQHHQQQHQHHLHHNQHQQQQQQHHNQHHQPHLHHHHHRVPPVQDSQAAIYSQTARASQQQQLAATFETTPASYQEQQDYYGSFNHQNQQHQTFQPHQRTALLAPGQQHSWLASDSSPHDHHHNSPNLYSHEHHFLSQQYQQHQHRQHNINHHNQHPQPQPQPQPQQQQQQQPPHQPHYPIKHNDSMHQSYDEQQPPPNYPPLATPYSYFQAAARAESALAVNAMPGSKQSSNASTPNQACHKLAPLCSSSPASSVRHCSATSSEANSKTSPMTLASDDSGSVVTTLAKTKLDRQTASSTSGNEQDGASSILRLDKDCKDSQLSRLHQQCAVILDAANQKNRSNPSSPLINNHAAVANNNSSLMNGNKSNVNTNGNTSGRSKRLRTSFKPYQIREMKRWFSRNQNPDAKELRTLAQTTNLTKRVLQVWFQNARAKWRRNNAKASGSQNQSICPFSTQTFPSRLSIDQQSFYTQHCKP